MKKYLHYIFYKILFIINPLLKPLDIYISKKYGNEGVSLYPPVFIIGAPRSGSTLLLKLLVEKYKFAYINNFTSYFFKTPICGTLISNFFKLNDFQGNYQFNFGHINGMGAPNECGNFWYRWFPKGRDIYVPKGMINKLHRNEIRNTIGGISYISKMPMINKNLYNSMRIAPIFEAIPEAIFIVCRRDYTDNALALLKSRLKVHKDKNRWWSLPPKEINELLNKDYSEQVAGQVYYTYRQIDNDKKDFNDNKFIEIKYEELCNNPRKTLNRIGRFLDSNGCSLLSKNNTIPSKFEARGVDGIDDSDRLLIKKAVEKYWIEPDKGNKSAD